MLPANYTSGNLYKISVRIKEISIKIKGIPKLHLWFRSLRCCDGSEYEQYVNEMCFFFFLIGHYFLFREEIKAP